MADNADYGIITGRFAERSTDTNDVDRRPQYKPWVGLKLVFVPEVARPQLFRDLTAGDEETFTMSAFVATTDDAGYVVSLLDPATRGMPLPSSVSPKIDPSGWTWRVRVFSDDTTTLPNGVAFPEVEFSFLLGVDEEKDLTTLVPVPPSPGAEIIDWQAAVDRAENAKAIAEQAALDAAAFGGTNNAQVASMVLSAGPTDAALKKRQYLTNVASLGILPSGSDQFTAMQAAVSAGGPLFIPEGDYYLSQILDVPTGAYLVGVPGKTRLRFKSNGLSSNPRIRFESARDIVIRDLIVQEVDVTGRTGSFGTISGRNSENITVDNVEVDGASSTGMHFINCVGLNIDGNVVHNTQADGIHFQRGCRDIRVTNNRVYDNGDDGIGLVSHDYNTYGYVRDAVVSGNVIGAQKAGAPGSGIAIIGAIGVTVTGNRISDSALSGIRVTAFFSATEGDAVGGNHAISDNVITNSGIYSGSSPSGLVRDGISVYNQRNVKVMANVIDKTFAGGIVIAEAGIEIDVIANKVTRAGGTAIAIQPASRTGNYLRLWTEPLLSDGTTLPYVQMHQIHVIDNQIRVAGTHGIYLVADVSRYAEGVTVRGNTVWYVNALAIATAYGIILSYAMASVVKDNYVGGGFNGNTITRYSTSPLIESIVTNNLPASATQRTFIGDAQHLRLGAVPTTGTYNRGDVVWNTSPATSARAFWECTASGTLGTLNSGNTTGAIASGTMQLTLSSNSGLTAGAYITIAGVTGVKKIMALAGTVATIDGAADATVSGAAVAFSAATFANGPALA